MGMYTLHSLSVYWELACRQGKRLPLCFSCYNLHAYRISLTGIMTIDDLINDSNWECVQMTMEEAGGMRVELVLKVKLLAPWESGRVWGP